MPSPVTAEDVLAKHAAGAAADAKARATAKLRELAQTQLEILASAFLDADYELALQAHTNARRFLTTLAENERVPA